MKDLSKSVLLITSLSFSSLMYADGILPSQPDFSGFYVGVGGGYTHTTTTSTTHVTMFSPTIAAVTEVFNDQNLESNLTPVVNAGYNFNYKDHWLFGVKGIYKYIGVGQFDLAWSGTFQDGTYQSAVLNTKLEQDFSLLFNAGYQFGNWFVYGGVGPALMNVKNRLNGNLLPATSLVFQRIDTTLTKTIWGGAGQVGFEYMLPNRFMVDLSYNFLAAANQLPTMYFNTGVNNEYTSFSQRPKITEQGVNITVNKYFG